METIAGNLYDFPKYYDLVYGSDWRAERDFLIECFERYATGKVVRTFEPACGTGRLLYRLARAGYETSGLDLNDKAVAFCNRRLVRHGYAPSAFVGDMVDFRLPRKVDAAFNTINSFRHLATHEQATGHLRCIARALRKGGIYVLGLHLTPTRGAPLDEESWAARRGNLSVLSQLQVTRRDLRRREERVGMRLDVYTPTRQFRIVDEIVFRTYTARQFQDLLDEVPELTPVGWHDFAYDIDRPTLVQAETEDVVCILQKR